MLQLKQASILGLLLLTTVLSVPAQAQRPRVDLELTATGALPRASGNVAIYMGRNGSENVAIRLDSRLADGETVRVTVINSENEERDLAVMTFELGTAFLKLDDFKADPLPPIFPTQKIEAMFVYYQDQIILEAKFPD